MVCHVDLGVGNVYFAFVYVRYNGSEEQAAVGGRRNGLVYSRCKQYDSRSSNLAPLQTDSRCFA
jgi:hypothetical protein